MPSRRLGLALASATSAEVLSQAESILRALRAGEVDALVVEDADGVQRVYTLETVDLLYRNLVESMTEGAALLDDSGRIVYANEQLSRLIGMRTDQILGTPFCEWFAVGEQEIFAKHLARATSTGVRTELTLHARDGRDIPVLVGIGLASEQGQITHCVTLTDLTEQKDRDEQVRRLNAELKDQLKRMKGLNVELHRAQRSLVHQTLHDPLTGLPNRTLFLDRLEQVLAQGWRSSVATGVFFIDLDGFKRVNDSFGHAAGDMLLRDVASRLTAATRPGDTVARFGGDEFLILTPSLENSDLGPAVAERLLSVLRSPPLVSKGAKVTPSIGLAIAGGRMGADELVRQADAAMYSAKQRGGNRWEMFGPELRREMQLRMTTAEKLRNALTGDRVTVHYQPVVDLSDGSPQGAEALVRLIEDDGNLLPPASFIGSAEETGLVLPLGKFVLGRACEQPRLWLAQSGHPWYVSVNVSPRQLKESDLVADVQEALERSGLRGQQLRLELTESGLIEVGPNVMSVLKNLRRMGVKIGVDDFGTGYASMSYVRHFPLDFVKIDQSFVRGMLDDPHDLAMVESTLALTRRLELVSVGEGIETGAHADRLRELGCDEAQGFWFARPQPSDRIGCGLNDEQPARGDGRAPLLLSPVQSPPPSQR